MQSIGNSLGMAVQQVRAGAYIPSRVEDRTSLAFSGPISRCHVVLELCGMDFSIFVQTECAMCGRDQGVGARRFEQDQAGIPASCEDELAVTSDGASDSASECGSESVTAQPTSVLVAARRAPTLL